MVCASLQFMAAEGMCFGFCCLFFVSFIFLLFCFFHFLVILLILLSYFLLPFFLGGGGGGHGRFVLFGCFFPFLCIVVACFLLLGDFF